jgi:hypothetical protein
LGILIGSNILEIFNMVEILDILGMFEILERLEVTAHETEVLLI